MIRKAKYIIAFVILLLMGVYTAYKTSSEASQAISAEPKVQFVQEEIKEEEQVTENSRYHSITSNITVAEKDTIARLVWLEARGETDEGQRAVVEVVLNRVLSDRFPNTIDGVVYQKNQFSPSKFIATTTATEKEYNNVEYVLKATEFVTEENVVFFSTGKQPGRRVYKKIGNHYFQFL